MSSLSGTDGPQKKIETAKEKKELADKAFQESDVPTGAPLTVTSPCHCGALLKCPSIGRIALRYYYEVNPSRTALTAWGDEREYS